MAVFLDTFDFSASGLSSNLNQKLPLLFSASPGSLFKFAGMIFHLLVFYPHVQLMPIALLVCLENTFWNIIDGNFVELFKKSFTLYVESGKKKKMEADIQFDIFINQYWPRTNSEKFYAKFYEIVIENFLRKFYYFYLI